MREISGLVPAADGQTWWALNDSGNPPDLYRLDARGTVQQRVRVLGVRNDDWEDLAVAPCPQGGGRCLVVGDIGDNLRQRPEVRLVFVPEPAVGDTVVRPRAVWPLRYADGPRDAEALLVHPRTGTVFVVTKGRQTDAVVYRVPPGGGTAVRSAILRPGPVPIEDQITGGAADPTGRWVALRTYRELWLATWPDALAGHWRHVDLGPLAEPQGESVAFGRGGEVRLASEAGVANTPATWSALRCQLPSGPPSSSPASGATSRTSPDKSSRGAF